MALVDWIILLLYAASTIALGWQTGKKQRDTKEYFLGSGKMNPALIGVSLFATLFSTISYLAIPGEVLGKGPVYMSMYVAYPFIYLFLAYVILPVYMRNRVTSAYELLEQRLGLSVRLLTAAMFLVLRLTWISLLTYMTAKVTAVLVGVGEEMVPAIVVATMIVTVVYTSMGGLRAGVIVDLMKSILLYGGALLVIGTVTWKLDGFSWFPTRWQSDVWDVQPIFSFDPATRVTVVGSAVWIFLWTVCTSVGDQVSVQRFMSTTDVAAARRAIAIKLVISAIIGGTLGVVGLALLGFFQSNPDLLPAGRTLKAQADLLFPHFIAAHLPPVVAGFVVSGLFAAAMSSISAGVNSITAVVMTDFFDRLGRKAETEQQHLRTARSVALGIGVVVVVLSTFMKYVPGNFLAVTNKTVNLLTVPIALPFLFALFVPFANARGVWFATAVSVTTAALIAFSGVIFGMDPVSGLDPISFQLIIPFTLAAGLVSGLVGCKFFSRTNPAPRAH
ncbi:MAG: sodium-coupled permease [Verrucomicrobia bacterium]|nr:sodium-coupled permease [Verrucomicrobiota bacterium]